MTKVPQCPFCEISLGSKEGRTSAILYQDDQILAFEDHNPSAFRHYLVTPVAHVKNVNTLKKSKEDHALVARMLKMGQSLLQRDAPNAVHRCSFEEDLSVKPWHLELIFGFHKPPFNSVDHLHLHCLALPYNSWWRAFKYQSLGCLGAYISVEHVLQHLDTGSDDTV